MTFRCSKCDIKFRVGKKRGESTMCSAPNCGIRFWHAATIPGLPVRIGITPEDAAALKATGEIAT